MTREDCSTCKHGKPMGGIIICEISNRGMTNTTKKCENYERLTLQMTFKGE